MESRAVFLVFFKNNWFMVKTALSCTGILSFCTLLWCCAQSTEQLVRARASVLIVQAVTFGGHSIA